MISSCCCSPSLQAVADLTSRFLQAREQVTLVSIPAAEFIQLANLYCSRIPSYPGLCCTFLRACCITFIELIC